MSTEYKYQYAAELKRVKVPHVCSACSGCGKRMEYYGDPYACQMYRGIGMVYRALVRGVWTLL